MRVFKILNSFLTWQKKHISEKSFIIFLSIIVGAVAGLAAILLKTIVHFLQEITFANLQFREYFFFPLIGIFLAIILSKLLYKESIGHAISDVLFAIFKKSGKMARNKTYSRLATSSVTMGLGGSAGLEAPIVLTGSAIGSNIARLFFLHYKNRVLLIGCGAAGVISAIFNAPITGVIFSIEIILFDISLSSFIPLLVSSITATLVSILLYQDSTLVINQLMNPFQVENTLFYILLGIFCALVAIFFNSSAGFIGNRFNTIKRSFWRYLLGGGFLIGCILLFPSLYGEGYESIARIINNQSNKVLENNFLLQNNFQITELTIVLFLVLLIIFKCFAYSFTINAGGSGGTFAPSLFIGCFTGFTFAKFVNLFNLKNPLPEGNFALVGMAGVLSATQYAPLTAIFLIAELTGGYSLFVPLMIVSTIAYTTVSSFNPDSPYLRHLIAQGQYVKGGKDKKILAQLDIKRLIEKDFISINKDSLLKDLIDIIKKSKRNLFPVIDNEKSLVGYITLDDVREKMFDEKLQKNLKISSLMTRVSTVIEINEDMNDVIEKFETTESWNLPVVENKRYVGFISKSRIFSYYRNELIRSD